MTAAMEHLETLKPTFAAVQQLRCGMGVEVHQSSHVRPVTHPAKLFLPARLFILER